VVKKLSGTLNRIKNKGVRMTQAEYELYLKEMCLTAMRLYPDVLMNDLDVSDDIFRAVYARLKNELNPA